MKKKINEKHPSMKKHENEKNNNKMKKKYLKKITQLNPFKNLTFKLHFIELPPCKRYQYSNADQLT